MTSQRSLTAAGLTLGYGDRIIVDDLDLTVEPGAITSIVGANGCGKSTLLRSLARLLKPRAGQVILDGTSLHEQPTKEIAKVLGLLPQSPIAPEGIVVADLVGRGRHPHQGMMGRWSKRDYEVVAESLAATNATELASRPVDELSGGQRQRVALARALVMKPKILLLDEPTSALDSSTQVAMVKLLRDIQAKFGLSYIFISHDLQVVKALCQTILVLKNGETQAYDTTDNIFSQPQNHYVTALIAHSSEN